MKKKLLKLSLNKKKMSHNTESEQKTSMRTMAQSPDNSSKEDQV